jgi:predicted CXXCH cytochrome family protein
MKYMKKITLIVLGLCVANAYAADTITFKGGVVFNHRKHQYEKVGVCSVCHEKAPGKIAGFDKEWAHKYCIECHDTFDEGPTKCEGCHPAAK